MGPDRDLSQALFYYLDDGVSYVDHSFTITWTNIAIDSWYSQSIPLEGKRCYQIYHKRLKPCDFCPLFGESMHEQVVRLDCSGRDSQWLEFFCFALPEKDRRMFQLVRDVTRNRLAVERKRDIKESLFKDLASTGKGIVVTDKNGCIIAMNSLAQVFTGWPLVEVKGLHLEEILRMEKIQDSQSANLWREQLFNGKKVDLTKEYCLFNRSGLINPYLQSAFPVLDGEGKIQRIVLLLSEKTENYTKQRLQEYQYKLETLHEIAYTLYRQRREKDIYGFLVEGAARLLSLALSFFFVREKKRFILEVKSGESSPQFISGLEGILEETQQLEETLFIADLKKEPGLTGDLSSYNSLISTPVGCQGFFLVISTRESYFTWEDVKLVEILSRHATESLGSLTSRVKMRHLSLIDSLTNLYNRSFLEEEIHRYDSSEYQPISIIMADINGLKLVNDTYGNRVGDNLLISAAKTLKRSCREGDCIARWAGDEFVVFLPNTKREVAQKICSRIIKESKEVLVDNVPLQLALGLAVKSTNDEDIYQIFREAEDLMNKQKLTESRSARGRIISTLLHTLGEKSYETEEHAWRMQKMAIEVGDKVGLPPEELDRLSLLLTLHDIGKVAISEEILTKPGRLTQDEWKIIHTHPEVGSRIAISSDDFAHVAEDILAHHERWDGKGYPRGLKGKEIPILARVTSIVDAYDVMTNYRSYKEAISREDAIHEIRECSGSQFDPELVEVFIKLIFSEPIFFYQ